MANSAQPPQSVARVIDVLALAKTQSRVAGEIPAGALTRLDELGVGVASVVYVIEGREGAAGKPALWVSAAGTATMQCQRCLESVTVPISVAAELELAGSQAAIDAADDDIDRVLGTTTTDVVNLVEDEVLLALPMVARHEHCVPLGQPAKAENAFARAWRERQEH